MFISQLETGARTPSIDTLGNLCTALHASLDFLMFGNACSNEAALAALLAHRPPEQCALVLRVARALLEAMDEAGSVPLSGQALSGQEE